MYDRFQLLRHVGSRTPSSEGLYVATSFLVVRWKGPPAQISGRSGEGEMERRRGNVIPVQVRTSLLRDRSIPRET